MAVMSSRMCRDCGEIILNGHTHLCDAERTTDKAAADTQHTASPVSDSPTQPAAPTQTPWAERLGEHERHANVAETRYWCLQYKSFARRLEALVHQQHQALYETTGMMDEGSYRDLLRNPSNPVNEALAAYAALEKEIER